MVSLYCALKKYCDKLVSYKTCLVLVYTLQDVVTEYITCSPLEVNQYAAIQS